MSRPRRAPPVARLLRDAVRRERKPVAFVLAGHNGSGKSTLWYQRLASELQLPLVNADRLTASILPTPDIRTHRLPDWALRLRDHDERWQRLSQEGVRALVALIMEKQMSFAFETVFSHWKQLPNGHYESKADDIAALQAAGYFVVLLFVGLATVELSILRVETRKEQGGHGVPLEKLRSRFPRTQLAVGHAAPLADMTLMFDNSRSSEKAFALVHVQQRERVLFDCRDPRYSIEQELRAVSAMWLDRVVGPFSLA